jgi:Ca-activated chloride channel family protein
MKLFSFWKGKKMKKTLFTCFLCLFVFLLVGCSTPEAGYNGFDYYYPGDEMTGDEYQEIVENDFTLTADKATSAMALSASTASYANLRSAINEDRAISADQIRIEEMINYFRFSYQDPTEDEVLSVQSTLIPTPWNDETHLLLIGMKAEDVELSTVPNNLVFLIDTSGSMNSANKLPLVQQSFTLLTEQLKATDRVSIVTYAGSDTVVLDGAYGDEKIRINAAINDLYASGSTAGARGLERAYQLAEKHFVSDGNNRVILATDGDFNVGISTTSGLENFISEKKNDGVYLSVLGFGYGNYKDNKLETLASKGNGNHAYIDSILEARKALITDINGTLLTVARDAKAQITFNEDVIESYRLIGYENKMMSDDEFEDSNTDAGEIGAGHQVTIVYEVTCKTTSDNEIGTVLIRYKSPVVGEEDVIEQSAVLDRSVQGIAEEDALFITSVVETGLVLRESAFLGSGSLQGAKLRIQDLDCLDTDEFKQEFYNLIIKQMD